jgi:hypothetical protein
MRCSTVVNSDENGMATLIFITLLAIMMILVTAETRALFHLHREIKYLEQKQINRLNITSTNAPVAAGLESK